MKYVAVLGAGAPKKITDVVFNYFDSYLVSMAEPTANKNWTLFQLNKQMKRITDLYKEYKKEYGDHLEFYVDSGGFQFIVGHIKPRRAKEYINAYHFLLKKYFNDFSYIFSLDVMNRAFSKDELIKFNDYSIEKSIELSKELPIFEKQLFIVQTRTESVFNLWKDLMDKHEIYKYYKKYSFGGLVGLKKETNAQFSHVVPFIFWLLTKIKINNGEINHIHLLGQSSKLMIFTAIFLENLLKHFGLNINFTMDSSELIRFAKLEHKLPIVAKKDNDFIYIKNLEEADILAMNHSLPEKRNEEFFKQVKIGKIENWDFVDFMCQNISNFTELSHKILDNKNHEELLKLLEYDINDLKKLHPLFKQGRLSLEIYNNLQKIKELLPYFENNDIENIEKICINQLKTY